MNGVKVSLHPAGHIIGSSQVRVEYKGEVWVVSGDYKTEDDGISGAFEPVNAIRLLQNQHLDYRFITGKHNRKYISDIRNWIKTIRRTVKHRC